MTYFTVLEPQNPTIAMRLRNANRQISMLNICKILGQSTTTTSTTSSRALFDDATKRSAKLDLVSQ